MTTERTAHEGREPPCDTQAERPLRIVVHDYSGHPGQAQLSRALARRGHVVVHQHCPSYTTGKGALSRLPDDPPSLEFEACTMGGEFKRYAIFRRLLQEVEYGVSVGGIIADHQPDVAIISNVPLLAHALLSVRLRRRKIPMIFWQQDIYSSAISDTARRKSPTLGRVIGWGADRIERMVARASVAVVAISPTFLETLRKWGVAAKSIVIPNWAPIDEIPVLNRQNAWSDRMGLLSVPVVMYSGTLGLKHDPSLLALIAKRLEADLPAARLVVVSEGMGRTWLEKWKHEHDAKNLILLDFQSYDDLPQVLASADVLVAILEPSASRFSVPSKVLTYLCCERAILGVLPLDNSVAEVLLANDAGVVVDPSDRDRVGRSVVEMLSDPDLRQGMGIAGRAYAQREFSPERAAEQFEAIFPNQ